MMNAALKTMSLGFKQAIINIYTADCLMLRERDRDRESKRERSVMVTWQKGGESLSMLPLLCLKIWHMHSQQQQ